MGMTCKRDEIVAKNAFIFRLPEAKLKLVISRVIKLVDSSRWWSGSSAFTWELSLGWKGFNLCRRTAYMHRQWTLIAVWRHFSTFLSAFLVASTSTCLSVQVGTFLASLEILFARLFDGFLVQSIKVFLRHRLVAFVLAFEVVARQTDPRLAPSVTQRREWPFFSGTARHDREFWIWFDSSKNRLARVTLNQFTIRVENKTLWALIQINRAWNV